MRPGPQIRHLIVNTGSPLVNRSGLRQALVDVGGSISESSILGKKTNGEERSTGPESLEAPNDVSADRPFWPIP